MNKLQQAINGTTTQIPEADLLEMQDVNAPLFFTVADIDAWCNTFNLQYSLNETTRIYTFSPL